MHGNFRVSWLKSEHCTSPWKPPYPRLLSTEYNESSGMSFHLNIKQTKKISSKTHTFSKKEKDMGKMNASG